MQYNFETGENIFFTSDTHFWHKNVIKYCSRPYESVEKMNEALIQNWNDTVNDDSIIFHLGDFGFCGSENFARLIQSLHGHIYWILGNHDYRNWRDSYKNLVEYVSPKMSIQIGDTKILLNHEPLLSFSGQFNNKEWQLFGHVHTNNYKDYSGTTLIHCTSTQYDVGVDFNNYKPVSFNIIKEKIQNQIDTNTNYLGYSVPQIIWKEK